MTQKTPLYEGKAKVIFEGPKVGTLIQYFKDDATAFNAQKKDVIFSKGILNNYISEHIMMAVGELGIPNHFISRISDREQLIRKLEIIFEDTLRINDFLTGLFLGIGVRLIDFKLEFGRYDTEDGIEIMLGDEISPDNCRLWDEETNEKMDKDRFRRDLGGLVDAYQEIARRLGVKVPEIG